jgi:hypothetical protein
MHAISFPKKKQWLNTDAAVFPAHATTVTGGDALHFFKAEAFPWPGYIQRCSPAASKY